MTVLLDSFQMNGHILGFHPQTQKLQLHLLTQGLTLGAKGLKILIWLCPMLFFRIKITIIIIHAHGHSHVDQPVL